MSLPGRTARHSYTLQVTLLGVTPPVWRLVAVPGSLTLDLLHRAIQVAMGWNGTHPYRFDIAGRNYEEPSAGGPREGVDPREISLDELDLSQGSSLTYIYDFADDWVHHLTVQGVAPCSPTLVVPSLLGGAGACPPEGVGGPGGYAALLTAMRHPDSPEGRKARERLRGVVDPAAWEPGDATEGLGRIGAGSDPHEAGRRSGDHPAGRAKPSRRGRR